jgi:hypothetical protein
MDMLPSPQALLSLPIAQIMENSPFSAQQMIFFQFNTWSSQGRNE